jgi:MFS superfamily sulfate permease-like transporter
MRPWPDCPWQVGLYTAFVPMVIYALLGSSRVLSVSSTTTLAILTGTQLGLVVPDGDPAKPRTATATLTALVRRDADAGAADATGIRRQLHFDAGADGLQGRHRPRDRPGSAAEAPGHSHHESGILPRSARVVQHLPETSLITLAVAVATFAIVFGMERCGRIPRRRSSP